MIDFERALNGMRIQEMKPGILHFKKKTDDDARPELDEPEDSDAAFAAEHVPDVELPVIESELTLPRWSLVSFDKREAGGLTYSQAAKLMSELDAHGIAGLCVVTDQAASRLKN